jgi:hypothetical protein
MMPPALTNEIRETIRRFESGQAKILATIRAHNEKLEVAVRSLQQSWSGSFAGWHGRMYFGEFEKPTVHEMFSPEWGGIRGVPEGWQERSTEEVAAHIDHAVGAGFSIAAYEKDVKTVREALHDLREDLKIELSGLKVAISGTAKGLVEAIVAFDFGREIEEHVASNMPKGLWSRDSEALSQGMVLPAWLFYEGVAGEAGNQLKAIGTLHKLIARLDRSLPDYSEGSAMRTPPLLESSPPLHPQIDTKCSQLFKPGTYAESVEKGFKVVRDRPCLAGDWHS